MCSGCRKTTCIRPLREPWFEEYNQWRIRWDKPIIEQFTPLSVIDEDTESVKQRAEEKKKRDQDREKEIATETEEEKKERLAREERLERIEAIRASKKEVIKIRVGSRTTEADRKNDIRSVSRKLDQRLFLIVKKNRSQFQWQLPQLNWKEGEVMKQTAERTLNTLCNSKSLLQTYVVGHAPISYVSYPYPNDLQKKLNTYGAKTFFYYSYYVNGSVSLDKSVVDYAWVTKSELSVYLQGEYLNELQLVLPDNGTNDLLTRDIPTYSELRKRKSMENVVFETIG